MEKLKAVGTALYQDPTCFCQVCGFRLSETPVSPEAWEFVMICPCCGMHYANDDVTEMMAEAQRRFGHSRLRLLAPEVRRELQAEAWKTWRVRWVAREMPFWHAAMRPEAWNPRAQLAQLGIGL